MGILVGTLLTGAVLPSVAQAHTGPANPVASSYVARLTGVPEGLEARVVGGDRELEGNTAWESLA